MGLFLALSGVIGASAEEVKQALKEFATLRGGGLESAKGTTDDPDIGIITRSGKNTTILYPNGFCEWDDASQYISKALMKPVFSFHIHDGDFWMFVLFQNGEDVGRFNPVPEYWGELEKEEKEKWKGDAELITRLIKGLNVDSISKYLVEWDPANKKLEQVYSDDEFPIYDCWQMCDFMKRIGLEYPMPEGGEILGETVKFWTNESGLKSSGDIEELPPLGDLDKPWWKFW